MGDCCCDRTASRAQAIMKKVPPCTSKSAFLPSSFLPSSSLPSSFLRRSLLRSSQEEKPFIQTRSDKRRTYIMRGAAARHRSWPSFCLSRFG